MDAPVADPKVIATDAGGAQPCGCDAPHLCERHATEKEFDELTTDVDCDQCAEKFTLTMKRSAGEAECECPQCGTKLIVEHIEYLVSRVRD